MALPIFTKGAERVSRTKSGVDGLRIYRKFWRKLRIFTDSAFCEDFTTIEKFALPLEGLST